MNDVLPQRAVDSQIPSPKGPSLGAIKLCSLASILVVGATFGFTGQYFRPGELPEVLDWSFLLLGSAAALAWYMSDAKQRSYRRSNWLAAFVLMIPSLSVPYYLIRSRGWRRGSEAVLLCLLFFALFAACAAIGAMLAAFLQL